MAYKQSSSGIPTFKRVWLQSEREVREHRVLDNPAGDPRQRNPTDDEFWAVCRTIDPEGNPQPEYRTLTPGVGVRCRVTADCVQRLGRRS